MDSLLYDVDESHRVMETLLPYVGVEFGQQQHQGGATFWLRTPHLNESHRHVDTSSRHNEWIVVRSPELN